jgi:phosphoribosylformimino-5-aminoimidazole carboxamide ribotide isomerase
VIDLLGGRAVHARGGRREGYRPVQSSLLAEGEWGDAPALARAYRRLGVDEIYVADLDAIAGRPMEIGALGPIGPDWVDAGVRDVAGAASLLAAGTRRVVVALETVGSWTVVEQIVALGGAACTAFSLDLRGGVPVGLLGARSPDPVALAARAAASGVSAVIVLDLARVGAGTGVDTAFLTAIRAAVPGVELIVGGGIRDAADLATAASAGCDGALVGTALHGGSISAIGARFF